MPEAASSRPLRQRQPFEIGMSSSSDNSHEQSRLLCSSASLLMHAPANRGNHCNVIRPVIYVSYQVTHPHPAVDDSLCLHLHLYMLMNTYVSFECLWADLANLFCAWGGKEGGIICLPTERERSLDRSSLMHGIRWLFRGANIYNTLSK